MNENINLVEILKDCPEGTEFYSPIFGKVTLVKIISKSSDYTILVATDDRTTASFTSSGKYSYSSKNGECLLFPSKDQRDWNVWKKEQDQKNIWSQFEDGDYLWMKQKNDYWVFIYRKNIKGERVQGYGCFSSGWDTDYYTDIMDDYQYIGTKDEVLEVRKATIEQIALFDIEFQKRYNKKWNPITKKFENIKTEMTISEIEKKLGLSSGSLRIKK
jgi:hypothetical protein